MLLSALGLIGRVVAAVGIFGVVSYFVSQRRQEIGVRMALGATPRNVLALVVLQGIHPVALGVVLGWIGSALATRALETLLYGVSRTDPLTMGVVAVAVLAIALAAATIPARRSTRIDPLVALRE